MASIWNSPNCGLLFSTIFVFSCGSDPGTTSAAKVADLCGNGVINRGEACDVGAKYAGTCPDGYALCMTCVPGCKWKLRPSRYQAEQDRGIVPYCDITLSVQGGGVYDSYSRRYDEKGQLVEDSYSMWEGEAWQKLTATRDKLGAITGYVYETGEMENHEVAEQTKSVVKVAERAATFDGATELERYPWCESVNAEDPEISCISHTVFALSPGKTAEPDCLAELRQTAPRRELINGEQ